MRPLLLLAFWLVPCVLFCGTHEEYLRAQTLVTRTVQELRPPADAVFDFNQSARWLGHLSRPWKTWGRTLAGQFVVGDNLRSFYQADSLVSNGKVYWSYTYSCDTTLAAIDYGENKPQKLTFADKRDFLFDVTAMTPLFLLDDFLKNGSENRFVRYASGVVDSVLYRTGEGKVVTVAIDPASHEVRSIALLYNHDMYGDVEKTFSYTNYRRAETSGFIYPASVTVRQLGFEASVVSVVPSTRPFDKERIASMIPSTYHLEPEPPEPVPEIVRVDRTPQIHLLELKHTRSRTVVVEFKDFLLISGAPLNVRNGELILARAREIAPNKPVRYFAFGHHHPHYLGGVRAFVHAGATILSPTIDTAYLGQIVSFPHTLRPDSLTLDPRPLKVEAFEDEHTVSDGELEMWMIRIGEMSRHADDFMIYYFPRYKLVVQDELASIPRDQPLTAAGERQRGLYDAILLHKLDVETILQTWPIGESARVKGEFSFDELQQSVEMIPPAK